MISFITEMVLPSIVIVLMFVLGTSLKAENFRTIALNRVTIVLAVVAQLVLLPLAAVLISTGLHLDSDLAAAVLILALCPGGAISNYYVYLARGDVALSIALTAVSTVLAVVTVPALFYLVFDPGTAGIEMSDSSIMYLSLRVLLLILLPVVAGMTAQYFIGTTVERLKVHLRRGSLALIALGVILATAAVLRESPEAFLAVAPAAMTFTVASWLTGMLVATLVMAPLRRTITIELTVRNVAVAAAIGVEFVPVNVLVAYLICYFIFEFVLLVAYALWQSGA
ncbi:MAG: bile acid:sodium symporter [Anderseniella sp.]|jgi:BASS family bile acid:Na+ symporter|nr:bile acid:sodium symporter [Anderseniella sp.]